MVEFLRYNFRIIRLLCYSIYIINPYEFRTYYREKDKGNRLPVDYLLLAWKKSFGISFCLCGMWRPWLWNFYIELDLLDSQYYAVLAAYTADIHVVQCRTGKTKQKTKNTFNQMVLLN